MGISPVSTLHDFDLLLCNDLRYNVRRYLADKGVACNLGRLDARWR